MTAPTVFISYSHKDEEWKERLEKHLRALELDGMLDAWNDRDIQAGDDWYQKIENALTAASIAVLLLSPNFLASKFIMEKEVPLFVERNAKVGVRIVPIFVKPCAWAEIELLSKFQGRPKDGIPLATLDDDKVESELAAIAAEIKQLLKHAGIRPETKVFVPLPPDRISVAKLPSTRPELFGRDKVLKELDDAWDAPQINLFTLIAWGGVGKTALVNKWLSHMARDHFRGAERVYGWSFYSQGAAEGRQVSADQFIASALEWFGDTDPNKGSPWEKGERLAELIKRQRTLLILDGLEPLQNPPPIETGKIKDPALVSLLRELARHNPGLVVISTRLAVDDLKDCIGDTVIEHDLESLSADAGAKYLEHLGVDGDDKERQHASHDFGGHALALTLLGSYLKVVHRGDIRKRGEIPRVMDERKQGSHARRVMQSYEVFLKGKPELDILRLLGLFDRPAEKGALDALRKEPVIAGLTDALQKLSDADWKYAIDDLRELHLLARPSFDYAQDESLDCHPLLREHFGEQLKENNPAAWREGNNRLYEWYKTSAKELPDTLSEMTPLFAAVMHGCQAGKHQEAYDDVYRKRIRRGNEWFVTKKLGAFGSELAMLSGFFGSSWQQPIPTLREDSKGGILSEAGYDLRALGRLAEASQPMQASLESGIAQKNWKESAIRASNLSELYLTIGDVRQALTCAEQSVQLADKSGDEFQRLYERTSLGDVQHQMGRLAEAQATLQQAEEIQKKRQPEFQLLYSFQGYRYCDLLLTQGRAAEVERRAQKALEIVLQGSRNLLDIALNNLSIARAQFLQRQHDSQLPITNYQLLFSRAVDGLRQAGTQHELPRGLLARAEYYRVTGDFEKSQKDLDEAFTISTRGGMGLFVADCRLAYARLNVQRLTLNVGADDRQRTMAEAREHLRIAKDMIDKMGYHRRDNEVKELEEMMKDE